MDNGLADISRDMFRFSRSFGAAEALWGIDYQRSMEYALAAQNLHEGSADVLDVGTGEHSIFPFYVAANYPAAVRITDIRERAVRLQEKRRARYRGHFAAEPVFEVQDARKLHYPSESIDVVTGISTVEHIEEDGRAAREIGRVLKRGGTAFLTLPFSPEGHRDVFRAKNSYTEKYRGGHCFFEHEYDEASLQRRIVGPSGLVLRNMQFIGEPGWSYREFFLRCVPFRNMTKYAFGWLNERLARNFLDVVDDREKAQIVALTLVRE